MIRRASNHTGVRVFAAFAIVLSTVLAACGCSAALQENPAQPPVPEGFAYREGTVDDGYVIADEAGNEFVWVPASQALRYDFDAQEEVDGDDPIGRVFYGEGRKESVIFGTDRDIVHFKDSVAEHGGFYISRYEAGDAAASRQREGAGSGTVVSQAGVWPYTFITRDEALAASANFATGDDAVCTLASSYAWDMVLQFAGADYWAAGEGQPGSMARTGERGDVAKNIHDLGGNVSEWTTEFSSNAYYEYREECVYRGTRFDDDVRNPATRGCNSNVSNEFTGFRMVIYLV